MVEKREHCFQCSARIGLCLSLKMLFFQADGIPRFGDLNLLVLPTKPKDIVFRFIIEYNSLRDFGP